MTCCCSGDTKVGRTRVRAGPGMRVGMAPGRFPTVVVTCCGSGSVGDDWSTAEELKEAEEYQRDLEEQVADVADRIKRLREKIASEEEQAD